MLGICSVVSFLKNRESNTYRVDTRVRVDASHGESHTNMDMSCTSMWNLLTQ